MGISRAELFKQIGYSPHARQLDYHNSDARFRVPVCGRRFGKSTMAARDLEPQLFDEGKMFWIVGPTYDLAEKEFRVIWNDLIIKLQLGKDKRIQKRYNKKQGDMFIEFPWGTRLECRSADHPENLVGEALHGVIMSEAAKHREDTFERYVRPALADYRGWADFPTTPEGQNWLYDMWSLGRNPNFPQYDGWRFPSWENPYLYPGGREDDEIVLLEKTMAREWFEQEIAADFTAFVGKVFQEFQDDKHVTAVKYNPAWKNYIAFDWGFVNPLAAVEFQVSPSDDIHIWRLHYKAHDTVQNHLRQMQQREQPPGYKIDMCFGDAADPEAVAVVSQFFGPCIALPEAKTNWREGIELVKFFLQDHQYGEDEYGTPLERPKLFIDFGCTDLIREFNNYKSRQPSAGRNPTSPKELPQAIDDHALDALRYGLVHIFKLGSTTGLAETMDTRGLTKAGVGGMTTMGMDF